MPKTSNIIEMNLLIFIAILSASSVLAVPHGLVINEDLNDEWETFKINFNRKYDPLTEISRRLIWEDNLKYIQQHNIEYDLGKHSYYLGINEFSDMTHEEFMTKYLGLNPSNDNFTNIVFMPPENMGPLPKTVDWRNKGYVTPVKKQVCIFYSLKFLIRLNVKGWMWSVLGFLDGGISRRSTFQKNWKSN